MDEALLTVGELAEKMKISRSTMYQKYREWGLPVVRASKRSKPMFFWSKVVQHLSKGKD